MRVFLYRSLLAAFLLLAAPLSVAMTDDSGQQVELTRPANRIVALTPHVTELLFAAGAGSKVVGVSAWSDYPAAAKGLPLIGDASRVDMEMLLRLKPDLVVGWASGTSPVVLRQIRQLGIPVWLTEAGRVDDIARQIRQLGQLAGTQAVAEQAAGRFERDWRALQARYSSRPPVSVFYQIWPSPPMTVSGRHFISDVVRACGGRNVFAELPLLTPTVSVEAVVQRNPQVIIASGAYTGEPGQWKSWQGLPLAAVQKHQLHEIQPDLIQRPTPRLLQGAGRMCELLQGARNSRGGAAEPVPAQR